MQAIEIPRKQNPIPTYETLKHPAYPVHIGLGLASHIGALIQSVKPCEQVFVIADPEAMACHGAKVFGGLSDGCHIKAMVLPAGEAHKNMDTVQQIIDFLIEGKAQRDDLLIAFGGGVTGDLVGFAASIYMRGMAFVQVPTTLLAQVDSSIGGKVGINLPAGKNLMGSFHDPALVVVDPALLSTLPVCEWQNGIGELVKYGFTLSEEILSLLPSEIDPKASGDWLPAIRAAIALKIGVVARDPKENGERRVLNFGHTLGHGLEKLSGFGTIGHGKAVAWGMVEETKFLESGGLLSQSPTAEGLLSKQLDTVLRTYGLDSQTLQADIQSVALPGHEAWEAVLKCDKKNHSRGLTLIAPSLNGDWQPVTSSAKHLAAFAGGSAVTISPKGLSGAIQIPSSKSMGHRSLIGAALADGVSRIQKLQPSADIRATLKAIEVLGAEVSMRGDQVEIRGIAPKQALESETPFTFPCEESGSTLRFMIPVAMLWPGEKIFEGKGRLPERPLTEYLNNFDRLGLSYQYGGKLPLSTKDRLKPGHYQLRGNESSQYLSGLLMALPLLEAPSTIEVIGELESKDYVALTLEVLRAQGIVIETDDLQHFRIPGNQCYSPLKQAVEGDYSQAAFWVVAGLLGNEPLACHGLRQGSIQADKRLIEIVQHMGGQIDFQEETLMVKPSVTKGTQIDASQCPDLIPALAVLASLSQGETRVINGQRLRIKESDRIKSTVALIKSLGGRVKETEDGMIIWGQESLQGGIVDSWGDHRIVMAAAAASVKCRESVTIQGAKAVNKSYPKFFEDFAQLGGRCHGRL